MNGDSTHSSSNVLWAFSTPVLSVVCGATQDLNAALTELILGWEQTQPSVAQSNVGGWQSPKNLQTLDAAPLRELFDLLDAGVFALTTRVIGEDDAAGLAALWRFAVWANVNRREHFNGIHYHQGGFWSGVYYVATPTPREGSTDGAIVFRNPSLAHMVAQTLPSPTSLRAAFRAELAVMPQNGSLLIFPSWLEHCVLPHFSDEPRISIAFDVMY